MRKLRLRERNEWSQGISHTPRQEQDLLLALARCYFLSRGASGFIAFPKDPLLFRVYLPATSNESGKRTWFLTSSNSFHASESKDEQDSWGCSQAGRGGCMEKGDPTRQGKMAVTEAQGQSGGLPLWGRHQRTKVALRRKESKTKP